MSKNIIFSGLTSALLLACGGKPDVGTLQTIQDDIAQALPTVRHISADKLEALINNNDDELLVLDIRPLAEYNVSRIKGALQLDPDIKPEYLSAHIGKAALGKTVIVYCSVGWRSSLAAKRLNQSLIASGATSVANISKPSLSSHFAILKDAGLIDPERNGNHIYYRLNTTVADEVLAGMMDLLGTDAAKDTVKYGRHV